MPWTADDIPDLLGATILVTGGNSGIGFQAARLMAGRGAHVVLACRNRSKADEAVAQLEADVPAAQVHVLLLDLADLASVREAAATFLASHDRLDVLVNNAGVMAIPYRTTADGFEMQFGTNHLGHFALTGLLIERLMATPDSRVVTVSSGAHRGGRIDFGNLAGQARYRKWLAYGQSKLANLLFTYELQRRLAAAGSSTIAVAAHPGYAATHLQAVGPGMTGSRGSAALMRAGNRLLAQSDVMGALPTVYAATAPDVRGGDYIGPSGPGELRGLPKKVGSSRRSHDAAVAQRLWTESERLTGISYLPPSPA